MIDYAAVNRFIGQEWDYDTNNCWHVFCRASKLVFGVDVKNPDGLDGLAMADVGELIAREVAGPAWARIDEVAIEACELVVMGKHHVGIYILNGMVLHCSKGRGCVFDHVKLLRRLYKPIEFYRYQPCHE